MFLRVHIQLADWSKRELADIEPAVVAKYNLKERQERDIANCPNALGILQQQKNEQKREQKVVDQKKLQEESNHKNLALKKQAFDNSMRRDSKRHKTVDLSIGVVAAAEKGDQDAFEYEKRRQQIARDKEMNTQAQCDEELKSQKAAWALYDERLKTREAERVVFVEKMKREKALEREQIEIQYIARHSRERQLETYDEQTKREQAEQAAHDDKVKIQRAVHEQEIIRLRMVCEEENRRYSVGVVDPEEERYTAFLIMRREQMEELDEAIQLWKSRNFTAWSRKELWQQERDRELSCAVYRQGIPNPHSEFI